jgi:hypothetical protein
MRMDDLTERRDSMERRRQPLRTALLAAATAVLAAALLAAPLHARAARPGPAEDPPPSPAVASLGADTAVYSETFDEPVDWIALGEDTGGSYAIEGGRYVVTLSPLSGGTSELVDRYPLPAAVPVLRVEASLQLGPTTSVDSRVAGVMCSAAAGLPRSFAAGIDADSWWLERVIDGRPQLLREGRLRRLPGRPDPVTAPVSVALECASVPEERGDRVLLVVDGHPVQAATFPLLDIPVGPYGAAGILTGIGGGRMSQIVVDDFRVTSGDRYAPAPEPRPEANTEG